MPDRTQPILVFGATGQQGGSVATALRKAGWPVRALVRDPASPESVALRDVGVELAQGTFADADVIRAAMQGAHGVFSVQPSSPSGTVSDEEEVRFGIAIADLAVESGVEHLVYTSGGAVGFAPTASRRRAARHAAALGAHRARQHVVQYAAHGADGPADRRAGKPWTTLVDGHPTGGRFSPIELRRARRADPPPHVHQFSDTTTTGRRGRRGVGTRARGSARPRAADREVMRGGRQRAAPRTRRA